MSIAVYPGTFDPITNGHMDIIARAVTLFDELIIAVGTAHAKKTLFDVEKRICFCMESTKEFKNVRVMALPGLTVDFARQHGAQYLVRGIRSTDDMNDELSIANMNRALSDHDIETVFFAARDEFRSVSSSIVREIIVLKGNVSVFVPDCVANYLNQPGDNVCLKK